MQDIRFRDWMNLDTKMSKILKLFIELENELMDMDEYQMGNFQNYSDFEDFFNQVAGTRSDFTSYVDEHKELLTMDDEINNFLNGNE